MAIPSILTSLLGGPVVAGLVETALRAALPDRYDWIGSVIASVWNLVDQIDDLPDGDGPAKLETVKSIVVAALDEADDIPGWETLDETVKDDLIGGLAEIALFAVRAAKVKGLPAPKMRQRFSDALRTLSTSIFAIIDTVEAAKAKHGDTSTRHAIRTLAARGENPAALTHQLKIRAQQG